MNTSCRIHLTIIPADKEKQNRIDGTTSSKDGDKLENVPLTSRTLNSICIDPNPQQPLDPALKKYTLLKSPQFSAIFTAHSAPLRGLQNGARMRMCPIHSFTLAPRPRSTVANQGS